MKLYTFLAAFVLFFASCSTAYKTGQTPDDVYFSPERQRDEYARVEKKESRYNETRRYENEEDYREDRYLRMKTSYRRYSALDDCDCYFYNGSNYNRYYDYYRNNTLGYYNNRWNPTWNYSTYSYNPYYYNPYYNKPYHSGYVAGNVQPVYNKPRRGNLAVYDNDGYNSNGQKGATRRYTPPTNNSDNYRNSGTNAGGFLRNTIGSGNSSNANTTTPSSSNNSSSSSSSSSSSGSTSAPVRKF